jgi:hypothetical protein
MNDNERVERALEYIRAQSEARQRARSFLPEQAHDRDLISQYHEYRMARDAEKLTRKIQERGRGR